MTRAPATSSFKPPAYLAHEDPAVTLVLATAWLDVEYGIQAVPLLYSVLGALPIAAATHGLALIAAELELANAVEACTTRADFEELTGVHSRSLSLIDDLEAHARTVRDDAAIQAEILVRRANDARTAATS